MSYQTFHYGVDPSQVGDLYRPNTPHPPVVCLLHGGFWRMPYDRHQMTPLAEDLARRGYAVWNLEYRRIGGGGGWPATFEDVSRGIDHLARLAEMGIDLDLSRVATVGHSAGGHLALWAAGRHRITEPELDSYPRVPVTAAVGQAPSADLVRVYELGLSQGVATQLVGDTPHAAPGRYAAASPMELRPLGIPQLLVHGQEDDVVPVEMSRAYVAALRAAGDVVALVELPGTGHFEHLDVEGAAWSAVIHWIGTQLHAPSR